MSMLAGLAGGLLGGGGGKGGSASPSSSTSANVTFGSNVYTMPTATPVSSSTGSNTYLIIGGAAVAALLGVLLMRK